MNQTLRGRGQLPFPLALNKKGGKGSRWGRVRGKRERERERQREREREREERGEKKEREREREQGFLKVSTSLTSIRPEFDSRFSSLSVSLSLRSPTNCFA